ncbi:MAG: exodeoxyribonuclease VII large subunit [Desulfohalobiaceae bacterium]|nr:exodeoxyribonuclease VII large subunit [Desulfohalobiaceae bacterium]
MSHIFTVRELTAAVKEVLESEFPFVWVKGQAGNISRPGSGHLYFSLKDQDSVLNCVWFKSNQTAGPNTSPEKLQTGQALLCAGRLAVYSPRGTYQLIAELVQDQGTGNLHLEFEALKKDLARQGYFDRDRKKNLPANPRQIGVVTSPSGAAIRDFLKVGHTRGLPSMIRIYPCLVQGEAAAETIASALEQANLEAWAEVLVLIRGGGSLEDLWSFNTQTVAKALFSSRIPVITGIGHETDQTIAGLTADCNGSTPTHAAQLIWPERDQMAQRIDELEISLLKSRRQFFSSKKQRLLELEQGLSWLSPGRHLERLAERNDFALQELKRAGELFFRQKSMALDTAVTGLSRSFPASCWDLLEQRVEQLSQRLLRSGKLFCSNKEISLEHLGVTLDNLNPYSPLQRGYSLVKKQSDGTILRSSNQVAPGDQLDIRTENDHIPARVESSAAPVQDKNRSS